MLANNIVKFENENMKIMEHIQNYFNELNRKNRDYAADKVNVNGTQKTYETDIRLYFNIMCNKPKGKELEFLSIEDISVTQEDFEEYVDRLFDLKDEQGNLKYVNKTINKKITALKGFVKYLRKKKVIDVDISYLELIKGEKERKNSYGCLEVNEVFTMAELARKEPNKGEEKRLLILFALDTCIRKEALLNLKWSSFIEREDGVMVKGIDKGNKEFRHIISKEFYQQLLTIKKHNDKVFDINSRRISDMITKFKKIMGIPEERNIVFHSIRKAGVTYRYRISNDILEAQRAANHSNINTTMIYLQHEDYGSIGAVSGAGNVDQELYKKVEHDVLIEALEQCKQDMKLILNMKINELMKSKK